FDANGNLIGTFGESLAEVCTPVTETVVTTIVTNSTTIYVTNTITITNCVGITNGVDFTGTAVPNKSLTLRGLAFGRPVVFSGLPVITLTNITGNYIGTRFSAGLSSFEFLTLSPSTFNGIQNLYDVKGSSGGYSYMTIGGHALLSRRGKIAFAIPLDPD